MSASLIKTALDLDSKGFAVLSIPHAWSLTYLPHAYSLYVGINMIRKKEVKMIDYGNPRPGYHVTAEAKSVMGKQFAKARGAHANGLEQMSFYIGAILIALWAGVPTRSINNHALLYLLSRAIYNYLYVFTRAGPLRTAAWAVGPLLEMSLLVKSALAVA